MVPEQAAGSDGPFRVMVLAAALAVTSCAAPSDGVDTVEPTLGTTIEGDGTGASGSPSGGPAIGAPDVESRSAVLVGLAVKGADPAAVADVEAFADAEVGIVRVFARWDTPFPTANHRTLLEDGRRIHLSVRPRTDGGRVIPWAEIAAAEPGSSIHDELTEWVRSVAAHGSQIYFTLNHEPETADSAANGDPEEFVAAWRRTVEMLRAAGGDDVRTVVVLGRGAYADGSIDEWYPGDDVVDVIGVDPYNWYDCQGTDRPWIAPRILLLPALDFAEEHGKPLAVPEIASTEDPLDPRRKAAWIRELGDLLADEAVAERVEFLAWFSVHDRSWPACEWEYDSSPESAAAMADLLSWYDSGR